MAWVRFTKDYEYKLSTSTTDYKAGMVMNVTRDCAGKAVKMGCAVHVKAPAKISKGAIDHGTES